MVEIKGTWNPPSNKNLWLVEVTGVNHKKFSGKRGYLLKSKEQDFFRASHYASENKYVIASVNEIPKEEASISYKKLKEFDITEEDIDFMFRFFGPQYEAKDLKGIEERLLSDLELCQQRIKKVRAAEIALKKLISQFKLYMESEKSLK